MKFLLTGKNGQVGFELQRALAPLGDIVAVDQAECDLSRPEIIINPAVDRAEAEQEPAYAVNGRGCRPIRRPDLGGADRRHHGPSHRPIPATGQGSLSVCTTWHEYAQVVAAAYAAGKQLTLQPAAIQPIGTEQYPLPAPRPANSRLDTGKLNHTFGLNLPAWQGGLNHVLQQIL